MVLVEYILSCWSYCRGGQVVQEDVGEVKKGSHNAPSAPPLAPLTSSPASPRLTAPRPLTISLPPETLQRAVNEGYVASPANFCGGSKKRFFPSRTGAASNKRRLLCGTGNIMGNIQRSSCLPCLPCVSQQPAPLLPFGIEPYAPMPERQRIDKTKLARTIIIRDHVYKFNFESST